MGPGRPPASHDLATVVAGPAGTAIFVDSRGDSCYHPKMMPCPHIPPSYSVEVRTMRSLLIAFMLSAVLCSTALGANNPISGIDPVLYSEAGWLWGTFNEEVSTIEFSNTSIILDIQPADDDGEYPGMVNGGLGTNYGSDPFGSLDFDHELYQVEMPLRILEDNEAAQFRITVADSDGTDGARDEYHYYVNTFDYEEGEWDTFVRPLTDYDELWSNEGGDGEINLGNSVVQLMTMWDSVDALNIEFGGIYITEIDPTPKDAIFELNANNFGQAWTWGSYGADGAVVYTENSIIIDADEIAGDAGVQGGLGHGLLQRDFDGETHELVVKAKLLEDNEAMSFMIEIRDDDEDLFGIVSDGVEVLDWAAEQYTYEVFTEDLSEDEFTEVRIPFTDYSNTGQAGGDVNLSGDGELNFGLYMVHIQSPWGPADRLNVEIESIRVEAIGQGVLGDYNNNGELDVEDLDLQAVEIAGSENPADFDLTGDGLVNEDDRVFWLHDLKGTWVGDADLDGLFDSLDFVAVFVEGKYETEEAASWAQGDWNADLVFDSGDFVAAFVDGGYEAGAYPGAVQAVPEPSSLVLALLSLAGLISLARRR